MWKVIENVKYTDFVQRVATVIIWLTELLQVTRCIELVHRQDMETSPEIFSYQRDQRRPFSSTLVCTSKIHQFVRSSWPDISMKIIEEALPITFVYFVTHTSAKASRSITFTQRFRTTWHLFSIQLLWKPKILNEEDKRTKFEQSTGDLGQFSELCKCLWHERNWASTRICIVFNMLVDEN